MATEKDQLGEQEGSLAPGGIALLAQRVGRRPKPASEGLGHYVYRAMVARGLTQVELARRAGLPPSAVSQIITGKRKNPTLATIYPLEAALGLAPGELLRLVPGDATRASLERFLESSLAADMHLTPDDVADLETRRWYGPNEDPPNEAWFDYVRARRAVRAAKKKEP